ncbi:MAG: tRNA lysidine(34) synthetase TilS [Methylotetracoccus sp.]
MARALTLGRLAAELRRHPDAPHYRIAFSGGLDSTVLLHACVSLRDAGQLAAVDAIHINHQLHADADAWEAHCRELCAAWHVRLTIHRVAAGAGPGESLEETARTARYQALSAELGHGDMLLCAHHADDQAETVLLQLLRGAGVSGLAGMPDRSALGAGFLVRPLLGIPRRALQDYASAHGLRWIEDGSNSDLRHARNYLRHEILPRLLARWPSYPSTLSRSARHCADAHHLLDEVGSDLLRAIHDPASNSIGIDGLCRLPPARQTLVLRQWFRRSGLRMPSTAILARALHEVTTAAADRQPRILCGDVEVARFRGQLHLLTRAVVFDRSVELPWDGDAPLSLAPGNGQLTVTRAHGRGIDPTRWRSAPISIRYRRGGEALGLRNRGGTHRLKTLLHDAGIPPWIRKRVPLVYVGEELAAVAGLWIAAGFEGDPDAGNIQIHWEAPALSVLASPELQDIDPLSMAD